MSTTGRPSTANTTPRVEAIMGKANTGFDWGSNSGSRSRSGSRWLRALLGVATLGLMSVGYAQDKFLVVDHDDEQVYGYTAAFATGSNFDTGWSTGWPFYLDNGSPDDVSISGGYVYVLDDNDNRVYRYNADGTGRIASRVLEDSAGNGLDSPRGLAVDSAANEMWLSHDTDGSARLLRYSLSDAFTLSLSDLNALNTYVLNSNNDLPRGLTIDSTYVYVVDQTDSRIYRYNRSNGAFSAESKRMRSLNSDSPPANRVNIEGICIDGISLYAVNAGADDAVYRYDFADLFNGTGNASALSRNALPSGNSDPRGLAVDVPANAAPVAVDDNGVNYTINEDQTLTINPSGVLGNDTDANGDILTAVLAAGPVSGSLTTPLAADGSFVYQPNANFTGTDTFTYYANDGTVNSAAPATVTITVTPVNDAPVAVTDNYSTDEDTPLVEAAAGVLTNDTDVDGPALTAVAIVAGSTSQGGTVNLAVDGSFTYTPAANFSGPDSFSYTVTDGTASTVGTVNITVNAVNDLPLAGDDTYSTAEDTALVEVAPAVLDNDTDIDGNPLTAVLVAGPTNGTLTLNPNGSFTYTPAANYSGSDSFTYQANDGTGNSNTATVSITVTAVNDAPVAVNDAYSTNEDTALAGSTVLVNDTDQEGSPLTASLVSGPANGILTLNANGTFTYTPNANFNGSDSFTYNANDGSVNSASPATVTITVNPVNDAPIAIGDSYSSVEDLPLTEPVSNGVLANDGDIDGDSLTAVLVSGPADGTLTLNPDGSFTYTPDANFNGTDSFTYKANDGTVDSNTVTVTLNISASNDVAVAVNDAYSVNEDAVLNEAAPGVLDNDTDLENNSLTAVIVTGPANASAFTLNADGSFSYTPNAHFNGSDSFTYVANDGSGDSAPATVTITVNPVNDAPVAAADSYSTNEDVALVEPALNGVLINDTDLDSDPLTAALTSGPADGTLILNADGSFTYTPDANFNGSDSFQYTVNDGTVDSAPATVTITVNAVADAPVAVDDSGLVADTNVATTYNVVGNDQNIDGNPLTVQIVAAPANGSVVVNIDNTVTYTSNAAFTGSDSFTYQLTDGFSTSNVATVSMTVTNVDDPPVANDDSYVTGEEQVLNVPAILGVRANDTDDVTANNNLIIQLASTPAHGLVVLNPNGSFTYTPALNFNGVDTFTYTVRDELNQIDTGTVTIFVGTENDAPVAQNDAYSTDEGITLNIAAAGVLANDSDPDPEVTTASLVAGPTNGTVVLNENGGFDYTPNGNFNGTDTFTYQAFDSLVMSNVATVTITVNPVNDTPVATNDTFNALEDTVLNHSAPGLLANDYDVDGDTLVASLLTPPTAGQVVVNGDGSFVYTPQANFAGASVTFQYQITDGTNTAWATATIYVTPVNDAPNAAGDSYSTDENVTLTVANPGVMDNDSDYENQPLVATLLQATQHGTVTLSASGGFTYVPVLNYSGTDSFTYQVTDGTAQSNIATVTITVDPVNNAPVVTGESYTTTEDTELNVGAPGLLGNDLDADGDSLVASVATQPGAGSVIVNGDGSFKFTPALNFSGPTSFNYNVTDGQLTVTGTANINVIAANDAPVAISDSYSTSKNVALNVGTPGVLANDTDVEGNPLTAILVQGPQHGSLTLNANGGFAYTPFTGYFGNDTFTYQSNDGTGQSNVATVSIAVNNTNTIPTAANDLYTAVEDTVLNIPAPGLLANDNDVDGDALTAVIETVPTAGSVVVNPDGSFAYTPAADFAGASATFTYRVSDGTLSAVGTVTIFVTAVNDAPVAAADSYSTNKNLILNIADNGVLANDSDVEGNSLTTSLVAAPAHGSVTLNPAGGFSYVPFTNYSGTDSFSYQAKDGSLLSNVATVTIAINDTNAAPVGSTDSFTTNEDVTLTITAPGVLSNDSDVDGDVLQSVLLSNPAHGTLSFNYNGAFVYTPDTNWNGSDSFVYRAYDGTTVSNDTIVHINVVAVNDAPIAMNDTYVTDEDTTLTVVAPGVLSNDYDVDGPTIEAHVVNGPLYGTLILGTAGDLTYEPVANWHGVDSFSYRAYDGTSYSNVSTATIVVRPVNDAPVGQEDNYGTFEDVPLAVNAPGVLADDFDIDGDILSASIASNPAHGTLSLEATGGFLYTPQSGFHGVDTFFYRASDGLLESNLTTVTITVGEINNAPVANDDTYNVFEDSIVNIPAAGVLANDYDQEDDVLTATLIQPASHGVVTLALDGSFTYEPNDNFTGIDTFTYEANDGVSDSNIALVTIVVEPVNDTPLVSEDFFSTNEEQELVVAAPGVLGNDVDNDGGPLSAILRDNPQHGVLQLDGNGSFSYMPDAGFAGEDTWTYFANDTIGNSSLYTTVTILVRQLNDAPVAVADMYIADEDTTLTVVAPGVLANDTDDDGDVLSATLVLQPLNGTVTLNEDGSFEYLGYPNFNGTDSFIYLATDGLGNSAPATVTITVRQVQDVPVANPDAYGTQENTEITIPAPGILANDVDLDGDSLTAILVENPSNGSLTFNSHGGFTYKPQPGFNSSDEFVYMAFDGFSNSVPTTVTINVGAVNDAPVANDDVYNVFEDTITTISAPGVLANDTDSDDSVLSATLINGPLYGTLVLNEDGSFVYEPFLNFSGTDAFTYQVTDGTANSNVATVILTIIPLGDAPIANEDFFSTTEELPLVVASPGVLSNDFDADGSSLTAILHDNPLNGSVLLDGNGSFVYTPNDSFHGTDYFWYRAHNGIDSELTTVTITVLPRNDAPVANNDTYVVAEGELLTVVAPGVLVNDTDADDDALSATLEVAPLHGVLNFFEDGSFEYTPADNYNGPDSFTYRATDGNSVSAPATVNIIVTPVQDIPDANDDNYSTPEDTDLIVPAPGVLANDVDLDGDALTALIVNSPALGTVTLNANGSFHYVPNTGAFGTDTFTYMVTDGVNVSLEATVTITVGAVNDTPIANPDIYNMFEDDSSTVAAPGVLQNDYDGDDDVLTATLISSTLYGNLVFNEDGSFTYTPLEDFNGTDYFTYQANDGISDSNVTTVTLNVVPTADKPLANPDFFSTTEELELLVPAPGVLGNDFDADGQLLTSIIQDNPLQGTVVLNGDGSFSYTPLPGFSGTDLFTYVANDGTMNSDKTTVTILIHPRNDRPISIEDIYIATEDMTLTVPASNGVLANDFDFDGDALSAVLINQPLHGSVALASDGSFSYTPNANFNGPDYFIYRAYDGQDYGYATKVNINVTPVQDVPVAVNDAYSIPEDKVLTVVGPGVLGNDYDFDNQPLTAHLVDAPEHGIISLNQNGSFVYTPDADYAGPDTFTYFANDGIANSNLATVSINVGGRNDNTVAMDDNYFTMEDITLNVPVPGVLGNDVDVDGDTLTAQIVTPPTRGTLTLNGDGSFQYIPETGFNGTVTFVYRAFDGTGQSNNATVTITVGFVNDAPILTTATVTSPINENSFVALNADLFDEDATDTFHVSINWGDGSAPTILNLPAGTSKIFATHQYLDDNPTGTPVDVNNVTLTVQDNNGGADTENLTVTVNNLAPTLENVSLTQVVPTGGTARLQGTIKDVGTLDTFVMNINWGDGNIETLNFGPGASPFDILHTYAVPGAYTVTVTVQDDDGGIITITPPILVRNTADLILTKTANPDPASVGELLTYTMTVTNFGPDMAHNVILMDTLPSNIVVTSSTPSLIEADGVCNWFLGDMESGQTYRIDLIVKTLQQGPITNVATVVCDDLDPVMANNTASVTTTIGWLPNGPDLMADAVTVNVICKQKKKGPVCTMRLRALVANRGTEDANACIYSVYLSDDNIFSPTQDMKLKTKRFGKLKTGKVRAQKQNIKTPPGYTTTGKFMIVVLDEGNLVFEGNETNNYIIYGPLP